MFGVDTVINDDLIVKELLKHEGVWHQNSKCSPAVAEEHYAEEVGKRLLLNEDDQYAGDDVAISVDILVSDNDPMSPKKFIQSQHEIIGNLHTTKQNTFQT